MSSTISEQIGDTLALVNAVRGAFGKDLLNELPDATRGQTGDCLFYRAFADMGVKSVGGHGEMTFDDERKARTIASIWGVQAEGRTVYAPSQFRSVIREFDSGRLGSHSEGAYTPDRRPF